MRPDTVMCMPTDVCYIGCCILRAQTVNNPLATPLHDSPPCAPCVPVQVYYREQAASMYNPWAYGWVMTMVEVPYHIVQVRAQARAQGAGGR